MKRVRIFLYVFILSLVQTSAEVNKSVQIEDNSDEFLPTVDIVGNFVKVFEKMLGGNYIPNERGRANNMNTCDLRILEIGVMHEFAVIQQPFGNCPYCCPIRNPSNHINLYFTNRKMQGRFVRLKAIKKLGAFRAAGIKKELSTIIYIHGFTEIGRGHSGRTIYNEYLQRSEDYNIIVVDWKELSAFPWYPNAVNNTEIVGRTLAGVLHFYNKTGEIELSKVHLIGFSLGAQISGFIGKRFKGRYKIGRITGLDPAFPIFSERDALQRLSKSDAEFVDVIHTNGGWFGFPTSLGHADYYPNGGGVFQSGCKLSELVDDGSVELIAACSHIMAYFLYAESVRNPKAFPSTNCGIISSKAFRRCGLHNNGYMGFSANKSAIGDFYLLTNNHAPYSKSVKQQEEFAEIID